MYEVTLSKRRKIVRIIGDCLLLFIFIGAGIYSFIIAENTEHLIAATIFVGFGIIAILDIPIVVRKKITVYPFTKIIYCNGYSTKEYTFSDIKESKRKMEHQAAIASGNPSIDHGGPKLQVYFYSNKGKTLFKLNMAYHNLERLEKDVYKSRFTRR